MRSLNGNLTMFVIVCKKKEKKKEKRGLGIIEFMMLQLLSLAK